MSQEEFVSKIASCIDHLSANGCDNESDVYKTSFTFILDFIKDGKTKLLLLVESLAEPLTDTVILKRSAGTFFLVDVLSSLGLNFLTIEELSYFVTFFCDRLKDNVLVIPYAVHGLRVLSGSSHLPDGLANQMITSVFKEVQVQAHNQQVRNHVFVLFGNFLQSRLSQLQEIEQEFVYGFIQAIDGEKDPRNLMIVFNLVPLIIRKFSISAFVEEFFEVISCYFPVDFTPPPNAPHGVTQQALIIALRNCLASTSLFAPHCLPLLLEKLDSDLEPAKIDALDTLSACSETYGAEQLAPFFHALWTSIRREMFLSSSEKVHAASLRAVTSITKVLSASVVRSDSCSLLDEFLEEILSECKKFLCEPELKLIQPTSKIVMAAASASPSACSQVLANVVPLLLDQFEHHIQTNRKGTVLEILLKLFDVYAEVSRSASENIEHDWNNLVVLLLSQLRSENEALCLHAMYGFEIALSMPQFLNESQYNDLEKSLVKIALKHDDLLRDKSIAVLQTLAIVEPKLIEISTVPSLMSFVTDASEPNLNCFDDKAKYFASLLVVGKLCRTESSATFVSTTLMKHIGVLFANYNDTTVKKASSCVNCLHDIVLQFSETPDVEFLLKHVFHPMLNIVKDATGGSVVFENDEQVDAIANLFSAIAMRLNETQSEPIIREMMNLESSKTRDFCTRSLVFEIPLVKSVLCYVPAKACVFLNEAFLRFLETVAYDASIDTLAKCTAHILASMMNKLPVDSDLFQTLLTHFMSCVAVKLNQSNDACVQQRGLCLWIWLTKALVMRGHDKMHEFVTKLIDCFKDVALGKAASDGFRIILEEYDFMSLKSHAEIRFLYHQRLFTVSISPLIQGFNEASNEDEKLCYLTAVNHLLNSLPHYVIMDAGHPLLPLLIQTLSLGDGELVLTALSTLNSLLLEAPDSMSKFVMSIVPCLLKISLDALTMKERIAALNCLDSLTKQPVTALLPVRSEVVHVLAACVDDKKRLVRQQAVKTRCNWYLIGEP